MRVVRAAVPASREFVETDRIEPRTFEDHNESTESGNGGRRKKYVCVLPISTAVVKDESARDDTSYPTSLLTPRAGQ